jgi:uncharacterized protein YyaL (SSP411 family)
MVEASYLPAREPSARVPILTRFNEGEYMDRLASVKIGIAAVVAIGVVVVGIQWTAPSADGGSSKRAATISPFSGAVAESPSGPVEETPPTTTAEPTVGSKTNTGKAKETTMVNSPMPGVDVWPKSLDTKLRAALAKRGKAYVPRTQHKNVDGSPHFSNRLIMESSPYLLQHAHNPVNWYPWGDEAFDVARREKKPLFMSIGYSTCHWCHVMEEESFEDLEIATYLNENYICIKVDREERPDVDSVYMTAVQLLTKGGGWPMSTWMTPDRMPFMAGTYFPPRAGVRGSRRGFLELIKELKTEYDTDPNIASKAQELTGRVIQAMAPQPAASGLPDVGALDRAVDQYWARFDQTSGGMRSGRKFPSSLPIRFLLRYARRSEDERAMKMVDKTLQAMYRGGLYDHVGGGFHRYTVDPYWNIPHFEKMLYDNALLTVAYVEAWQHTKNPEYRKVAQEVLDYIAREMTNPAGAFYSATDADSEGEEGKFFVWTPAEIRQLLSKEDAQLVIRHYGVSERGNFERHNHLQIEVELAVVAKEMGLSLADADARLQGARKTLYDTRAKRIPPIRDDKVLTDWNGLMISAFAQAGLALRRPDYVNRATQAATFLLNKAKRSDGRLMHVTMEGRAYNVALLEDYAFFVAALLDLHEATGQDRWLSEAIRLQQQLDRFHWDNDKGGYYLVPSDHEELLVREKPDYDGAVPTGNSVATLNLLRLATFTFQDSYRKAAEKMVRAFGLFIARAPGRMSEMLIAVDYLLDVPREVVVVSPATDTPMTELLETLGSTFLPNRAFTMVTEGAAVDKRKMLVPWVAEKRSMKGKATAYVCEQGRCELPTSDPKIFAKQLSKIHRLHPKTTKK